jgi:hypothetical protein
MTRLRKHVRTITGDIEMTVGGKKLPPRYDWKADPNHYSTDGHIPANRCYLCGYRFVGSQYAAFCNICDNAMTPDNDDTVFTIGKPPDTRHVSRWEIVSTRIRIPDDVIDEKAYAKKLDIPEIKQGGLFRADQLI